MAQTVLTQRRPKPSSSASTIFIVGAGFSMAANENQQPEAIKQGIKYPTLGDLAEKCFTPPIPQIDVEREFASRYWRRRKKALSRLVDLIETADLCVGVAQAKESDSVYHRLLDAYPSSHFISFNYDCLLEMILQKRGEWFPHDGFGIRAEVGPSWDARFTDDQPESKHLVLHLHGSTVLYSLDLVVSGGYTVMTSVSERKRPRFIFEPGRMRGFLGPFGGATPRSLSTYKYPADRLIAPVPSKGNEYHSHYVRAVFEQAVKLLGAAESVIAIGYRFADSDGDSFLPLLHSVAAANTRLLVVAPDATEIVGRLEHRCANLRIKGMATTLGGWAIDGFRC